MLGVLDTLSLWLIAAFINFTKALLWGLGMGLVWPPLGLVAFFGSLILGWKSYEYYNKPYERWTED